MDWLRIVFSGWGGGGLSSISGIETSVLLA
jgi:hypothetical protein